MTSSKVDLSQPPKFLSILGAKDVVYDKQTETITIHFDIGEELTHSNGAYDTNAGYLYGTFTNF